MQLAYSGMFSVQIPKVRLRSFNAMLASTARSCQTKAMLANGRTAASASGGSQVDLCYTMLRGMIVSCELAPSTRLTERELMARLNFGRTPIREALLRLDQDRLIETLPRSGYRVRSLTRKSIIDFFAVWSVVAPLIARLAVTQLTPDERHELLKLGRVYQVVMEDSPASLARVSGEFFNKLVEVTRNEPLIVMFHRLGAEMERIFLFFFNTEEGRRWIPDPNEMAAFTQISDPDHAARIIETRVAASRDSILAHIETVGDIEASDWFQNAVNSGRAETNSDSKSGDTRA